METRHALKRTGKNGGGFSYASSSWWKQYIDDISADTDAA
jgi:hypothetical protein